MRQYRRPCPSQKTNQYVKKKMLETLKDKDSIGIAFLSEDKILELSAKLYRSVTLIVDLDADT